LGIFQLHLSSTKLDYFFVQTDDVSIVSFPPAPFVLVDSRNQLWVHPKGGGFSYYDEGSNQLKPFFNTPFSEKAKFSNMLHSGFFDRQGNLWLGARSHGLDKVVFNKSYFKNQKVEPSSRTLFGNNIRAVYADKSDNIWVSSKENRLYLYNPTFTRRVQLAPNGKTTNNVLWPNAVYSVLEDSQNNIWLGTRGSGVYKFSPQRNGIEYSVEHFEHDRNDEYSLSNNNVYTVFEDKLRRTWIGTWGGGLNRVVTENGKVRFVHAGNRLKNYPKNYCSRVRFITDGRSGHVYLGTTDGLLLIENNPGSMDSIGFKLYRRQPGNAQSISNNDIIDVAITQSGDVFMATSGGGINKVVSYTPEGYPQTFKAYTRDEGMPSDLVVSLTEDFSGKLWIGTESGMCRFDPASEHFEVFPEVEWIMNDHSFSEATRCRLKTGEILLGYSGGILSFFPEDIKSNQFTPYLALFNLQLFNKKVPIHGKSPIRVGIDDSKELVLSKKQNFFSIEFAALDLINPKNIKYAYMLEGLDKDWNYTQTKRIANYTNIPKGAYTFRVKSTNSDGVWVSNERVLPITIKPAFWETPLAYTLYFLLFALIIFLVDYNLLTIYRLKSSVAVEKKMSEMKQKFFVDISHEIRTPLTMITAPVEYLLNDGHTPDPVKKQLTFISHSTNRLLRLVNQILDLKKLQDSKLKIQEIELVPLVYEVFNSFVEIAKENSIDLRFKNQLYDEKIWADKDSIEKIVMNLLSNAFKHTGKGKAIEVRLSSDSKYITISVMDEGSGISKERQKNLFVRFMSFNDDPSKPSTGIGLALIKELADKHKAKVTLESETDKGSTFSISFLKGKNHFLNHPEVDFFASNEEVGYESEAETNDAGIFHKAESRTRVLVVEDDHDLRTFIANILEEDYEVLTADDGQSGFETAKTHFPDFIISDIMMPRMDGIELLRCIRNDINTSHIPVVLLTAKANIESKLEGLAYGADDYITKPFSVPYLKARMANLLEQRKRLQEMLGKTGSVNIKAYDPKPFLLTKHDENMMEKVMEAIEQNMDNDKFTIEELATKVGINRTTFQNKMKSLTGFTPLEFVREIRLKRAAQLITDSRLLMKEVSYMTGFTDTKYFGKCFKAKYGVTPLEYRNREK
jgi:signal transduction histidine kinase/DNA-binding response OmpR family regulator/streptogramin lyase